MKTPLLLELVVTEGALVADGSTDLFAAKGVLETRGWDGYIMAISSLEETVLKRVILPVIYPKLAIKIAIMTHRKSLTRWLHCSHTLFPIRPLIFKTISCILIKLNYLIRTSIAMTIQ